MENRIFNIVCLCCIFGAIAFAYSSELVRTPNPWTDCAQDFEQAAEVSGIDFQVPLSDYEVRAMDNMVEIRITEQENLIILRKSLAMSDNQDNSGDYNNYRQNEPAEFNPDVMLRKKNGLVYVMYFTIGDYRYSVRCTKGMSIQQAEHFYNLITK